VRLERKRACPACGRESAPAQRFCDACGAGLDDGTSDRADLLTYTPPHLAERILTTRSMLEGERRNVTVLFADVAGSTAFAENIDPEEVHALMDRCFKIILEQVHRYEGTVNQFTGDGAMALFGAPLALEDAPRRAVIAALGMQEALHAVAKDVRARHGRDFHMRIGINSGLVVVGKIGDDLHMDYTAVGDTTNLANRLQQVASPGSIVISEATQKLVAGYFDLRDLGEITVKGRAAAVHAFEVIGEREVMDRIDAVAAMGLTPLVGRDRDLEQLTTAFDAALASHGQVVFVVGDAGIGKSRLLHEFQLALAACPHAWMEGRCASYARTTAFHVVADAVRRKLGIGERDDELAALAKIEAAEQAAGGGLEWTLPYVRALLSLPIGDERVLAMDAITRRSETFRALHARFLRDAQLRPVVLVIEDVHWIDSASEEFLAFLAESMPATRALLILTHRPGYRHVLGDRSYHVRLTLQPLSAQETERMTARVLSAEVPDELRELIFSKAEGNPFFVEEVTKSLLEDGTLQRVNGRIELARELSTIAIPDSIQDVIMARIDRLEDEPKRAIQIAAVIGREFALRLLERVVAAGDRVSEMLGGLRTLELIYEKSGHPELAFMFKHALTHDVAYETILLQRRKALHGLVGDAIQELYADRLAEHYEAMAHHYVLAERWEPALEYHVRAAKKAVTAYANQAAADHYRRALEIAELLGGKVPAERRAALLEGLASVLWCLNEFRTAGDMNRAASEITTEPELRSMRLSRAGWYFHWGHDYGHALRAVDEALVMARSHESETGEILAHLTKTFVGVTLEGDLSSGAQWVEAAKQLEPSDERRAAVRDTAHLMAAESAEWKGDYRAALATFERLLESGSLQDDPIMHIWAEWFSGKAATCLGRYGLALTRMHDAVDRSLRVGDRAMQARLLNTLGWCYAELGCDRIAVDYNVRAATIGLELVELQLVAGAPEVYGNAALNLAGNRIVLGDLGAADEAIASVEKELAESSDPWMRWRYGIHAQYARARYLLARGEPELALPLIDSQVEAARRHEAAKIHARALELRGRTFLMLDRRDDAEAALHDALRIARDIAYPPSAWHSLAMLAELARRAGSAQDARRHGAEASQMIAALITNLTDDTLRVGLRDFGAQVIDDPLAALR
jgi:class 3 adenylate cyclase/tetratricopeptide (TPR) repeat protein